ncbi:MAG: Bax inhibitor-1 family protein [Elusimicrobiaceae bacterium]|nr:Bax inhibitor-1 family protein [Elusimicrobiaceae bacterium]
MFETLMSKTFVILSASLVCAYAGCLYAQKIFNKMFEMQQFDKVKKYNFWAIFINIAVFIVLMFTRKIMPLNMVMMALFTLASGFTLGLITLVYGDTSQKALGITALTTLATGLIATYSGLDFAWLGKFLFIGLIILVIVAIINLFIRIKGNKFFAAFGVLIFTGYLLFDFNNLAKLKQVASANNWETALDFAISIYLDIVNLFINLIQLIGSSNN